MRRGRQLEVRCMGRRQPTVRCPCGPVHQITSLTLDLRRRRDIDGREVYRGAG